MNDKTAEFINSELELAPVPLDEKQKQKFKKLDIVEGELSRVWDFRRNMIKSELEWRVKGETEWKRFDEDADVLSLWRYFIKNDFENISANFIYSILRSDYVNNYNAIKDYFNVLMFKYPNPSGYIDKLANTLKVRNDPNWRNIFKKWFIASAGCGVGEWTNDVMLLLIQNAQGSGKSWWCDKLTPPALKPTYWHRGHIEPNLDNGQTNNLLAEVFLLNVDDQLASIFTKDLNSIKGIISLTHVNNRQAYHRKSKHRKRIANFVGSVNEIELFVDTENRRYFALDVETVDSHHTVDMDGVWAEAYFLYKTMKLVSPYTKDDFTWITNNANKFALSSDEEELLLKYYTPIKPGLTGGEYMTTTEIKIDLEDVSKQKLNSKKLGRALQKNGFIIESKRLPGVNDSRKVYHVEKSYSGKKFTDT